MRRLGALLHETHQFGEGIVSVSAGKPRQTLRGIANRRTNQEHFTLR